MDTPQNEMLQNNTAPNNEKPNPKRSWIRRHPILSIIFGIIILIIIIPKESSKNNVVDINNENANTTESASSNKLAQLEECHVSKWQTIENGVFSYTLSNVSWQSTPISFSTSECAVMIEGIKSFQDEIELGNSLTTEGYKDSMSSLILPCAKSANNEKLREVAKKCNGKWF